MHGLQFSDKVKQLPRLTPIWAHGAVLAGVRLSESGNPTVLAPGVKCGECLKCVECKWKESGAAAGGSARRELAAIRLIGGGVVIDPGISPLPGADHPPEQDAPAVCSSRRSRCRHPLVCDRRTIASSTRRSSHCSLLSSLGGTIPTSDGSSTTKRPTQDGDLSLSLS